MSPMLLGISYKYDNYPADTPLGELQQSGAEFSTFFKHYISLGFQCAFNFVPPAEPLFESNDICQYSMFPLLMYTVSIFGLQLSIQTVSENTKFSL